MTINKIELSGYLATDPALQVTRKGISVVNFTLAVNDEKNPYSIYCYAYGKNARFLSRSVPKNTEITITGQLKQRKWKMRTGEEIKKYEILVSKIEVSKYKQKESKHDDFESEWID